MGINSYKDFDNNIRIAELVPDMGAFEIVPEPCLFIIYNLLIVIYYRRRN